MKEKPTFEGFWATLCQAEWLEKLNDEDKTSGWELLVNTSDLVDEGGLHPEKFRELVPDQRNNTPPTDRRETF